MTRRDEFAAVRRRGKTAASRHFVMATLSSPAVKHLKIGIIASRRAARRAVVRNKIRRRLRSICSMHGDRLQPGRYLVMVVRRPAGSAEFKDLEADWLRLASQLGILRE
jgi:ribonuclease P protein component